MLTSPATTPDAEPVPTPAEFVKSAFDRIAEKRAEYDRHIEKSAQLFGSIEKSRRGLHSAKPPAFQKALDDLSEAQNALSRLPQDYATLVMKSHDVELVKHKQSLDLMLESFAMQHAMPIEEAHAKLLKSSPTYRQGHDAWSEGQIIKSDAIASGEAAIAASIEKQAWAEMTAPREVERPSGVPAEQAILKRAAQLAKARGVTPEQALADALGTGAHEDDEIKALYDDALEQRAKQGR